MSKRQKRSDVFHVKKEKKEQEQLASRPQRLWLGQLGWMDGWMDRDRLREKRARRTRP
jgi:hypothetical protein